MEKERNMEEKGERERETENQGKREYVCFDSKEKTMQSVNLNLVTWSKFRILFILFPLQSIAK